MGSLLCETLMLLVPKSMVVLVLHLILRTNTFSYDWGSVSMEFFLIVNGLVGVEVSQYLQGFDFTFYTRVPADQSLGLPILGFEGFQDVIGAFPSSVCFSCLF